MEEEQLSLVEELAQGKELARQLCDHILSSSRERKEFLIDKILCSYEKALKMLNWEEHVDGGVPNGSPRSDVLDLEHKNRDVYKKRKTMPRWTEHVKVCSKTEVEGSLDDGYSWRKYGQKDILGAKFPRGYYRCTHRNAQGCLATKQVQKSDEDPSILEVTYRGRHTCNNKTSHLNKASKSKTKLGLEQNHHRHHHEEEEMGQTLETIFNFGSELEARMEDIFPSFGFPSTSENSFMENFSAEFISPETSESNLLSMSGMVHNVQTSESDVTDTVSAPTSVTNSPLVDLDLLFEKEDFQTDFSTILDFSLHSFLS